MGRVIDREYNPNHCFYTFTQCRFCGISCYIQTLVSFNCPMSYNFPTLFTRIVTMTENQLARLRGLTESLIQNQITKCEFMEYQNLNELFLNELNLDQAEKRKNSFLRDIE